MEAKGQNWIELRTLEGISESACESLDSVQLILNGHSTDAGFKNCVYKSGGNSKVTCNSDKMLTEYECNIHFEL